jgi:hypothetical protein
MYTFSELRLLLYQYSLLTLDTLKQTTKYRLRASLGAHTLSYLRSTTGSHCDTTRSSESPCLLTGVAKEDEFHEHEPFPVLLGLNDPDDRIESSQAEESFEFAFHIPPPPLASRKPLRRRTPRVSADGTVTRNLWSQVFEALAATQKSDPIAAQSPRKRAASSPVKLVAEQLPLFKEKVQECEEDDEEGTSHEQSSFRPFRSPSPTKPTWPSNTPQRQPSPLRLLLSQTSDKPSESPTKCPVAPFPLETSAFPSPKWSGAFPSPSKPFTIASPSRPTPSTSRGAPFMTPKHLKFPSATGPEGSPSTAFGLAYVSPPRLPYPGGSTPIPQNGEEAGVSQYPESLADELLPDFLLTFGESQGMEDWIEEMQKQR